MVPPRTMRPEALNPWGEYTGPFQPTIIVCPPHVVDVWFAEQRTYFPDSPKVWRYYETADKVRDIIAKQFTLDRDASKLKDWIVAKWPKDELQPQYKVVVTDYDTLAIRGLQKRDVLTQQEPHSSSKRCRKYDVLRSLMLEDT